MSAAVLTHLITEPMPIGRERLAEYRERGGYASLQQIRDGGSGSWAIAQIARAGLRGRGGSGKGHPVAEKWRAVARSSIATRYVVANGAESSGTSQKDRYLMTYFPHRVLDGLLIAAAAVEASAAYLYVRGDAEKALASLKEALGELHEADLLGGLTIEIQPSAATYTSGEESALLDALEGLEGLPQPKPPLPEETGLRGCPTLVNNVESLAAAAAIFRIGVDRFRSVGTPDCPGTALFTVTGAVCRPGIYEVAYGTPLSSLLAAAGAPPREAILCVLPGGLSSGPLRPDELDLPLTYDDLMAVGSTLGPAAILLFDRAGATLPALVTETVSFLDGASCGQCQGCKEAHRQLLEALEAGEREVAMEAAGVLLYGRGNCAHPTGTARLALRALRSFPEVIWSERNRENGPAVSETL